MSPEPSSRRRVLVAEADLALLEAVCRAIEHSPSMMVCGTARDGIEVLERIRILHPDAVVLDIAMPYLSGIEVVKHTNRYFDCPVILLSSLTQHEADLTIHALSLGAFDYLPKPDLASPSGVQKLQLELAAKIQAAATRWSTRDLRAHRKPFFRWPDTETRLNPVPEIIAIGASTGGPRAVQEVVAELPPDISVPVVVVQHMPPGFTQPFAERLNILSALRVREARNEELIEPGTVYVAPAGKHCVVQRPGQHARIVLSDSPADLLHKPSVDLMMMSVAEAFGPYATGIILTGMGSDGLRGMTAIREAGGLTIGQDESTSTVYGMPRACAESGILQEVLPIHEIPARILKALGRSVQEGTRRHPILTTNSPARGVIR